jgi:hypothetical protein
MPQQSVPRAAWYNWSRPARGLGASILGNVSRALSELKLLVPLYFPSITDVSLQIAFAAKKGVLERSVKSPRGQIDQPSRFVVSKLGTFTKSPGSKEASYPDCEALLALRAKHG